MTFVSKELIIEGGWTHTPIIISHGVYVLPALFFISLVILSQAQKSDYKRNICSGRYCFQVELPIFLEEKFFIHLLNLS